MTPKIQKKMNALQTKMQKKHPDYDINYVYDKKGKVYALSYNENTQQFVSLKNMKPVSQDSEFFDANDQPFTFSTGPDLYEVFDKDGNQTVLAFDKDSSQFFNPETGEPVDIENYNDAEGNPIDPAQFISDDQPNDGEVSSENDEANQEQQEQSPNDEQPVNNESNNDFVEEKYEESVPTTEFQGLEYASPTVDVQPNNLSPENVQSPNLNQPDNQQNNGFYPNDNYQAQDNNYLNQQLPSPDYNQPSNLNPENVQSPNLNQPDNQQNNGFYPNDNYQAQDNSYSNPDYNQPNNLIPENVQSPNLSQSDNQQNNNLYSNDNYQPQNNNYPNQQLPNPDYNQPNNYQDPYNNSNQPNYQQSLPTTEQNNYQFNNKPSNLEHTNFNQPNNEIPNPVQQLNQDNLNFKTIDSSTIPTTEVVSSFNNFAAIPTPTISISEPIVNKGYVQPNSNSNDTNASASVNDNFVKPILETVVDSIVDVKLDPIVQDSNKPKDQFSVIEEPQKPADSNKQFIVSEENGSSDLFTKKTAEIFIDESFNRSIFSKPNKNQDVVIPKPVIDSEQSLFDSKVFISPEVRPQPQAVYSSATTKKDFEPNNSYSSKINLKDFNPKNEAAAAPNLKSDVNLDYEYTEVKPIHKPFIPEDYQSADLHDFEINKPKISSEPKYDQSFSEYPEYEPHVQDFEYNPDEQHDLYEEKPYSSLRSYRDYQNPRYYPNNNYLANSDYSYYKRDNELSTYNNYQPLNSFRSSGTRPYASLRSLDSSLLPSSRPSSHYPASRSLTVLIDNYSSPFAESRFKNYRSAYGSRNNYYRSPTYGFSSIRSLSDYGPYKVRSFKNWQPSSLTSSINTYSMPLPSSYRGYSNRLRNYRNW